MGAITKIELVHANGTLVADLFDQRAFANLLSNNAYTVKVTYVYDLNDGEGEHTVTKELLITTDAKTAPSFAVKNENITAESINAEYDITDIDSILSYYKIELYKGNTFVSENSDKKIEFTELDCYNDYTVKFTYKYDLNDGTGEQTKTLAYTFKTLPFIDVTECSIANTSAVSEGETIFMSVKLNNPLGMNIESVVINGETYNVTGASTKNKIFVEIVYNGQFAGGDTYLKIDKVNAKLDSTTLTVEPKSELSDNVFINGKIEVLKIEYVNEDFQPIDWAFPSDRVYVLITLDNPTGYTVDSIVRKENFWSDGYTVTSLEKLDDNRWYCEISISSGWNEHYLTKLSYSNEYIEKSLTYSEMIARCYEVASDEVKYISTPADLKNMNGGYYYELTADIDLSGIEWQGKAFDGVFDGKGYSIKNMSYVGTVKNADVYLGLFGESCGVIKNVNVEEATIVVEVTADDGAGHSAYVGGIAARYNDVLYIHNSSVDEYSIFTVKNSVGSIYIGGIVGYAQSSTITSCTNSGSVSATSTNSSAYAGGIVGNAYSFTITNCTNSGSVSATSTNSSAFAGGIVGNADSSIITNCTNSGSVSATGASGYGTFAGGIAGQAGSSAITNCTNSGDVSSSCEAGGIVGRASSSTITNCTNSGDVSSSCEAGGIVGYAYPSSTITNCTNSGSVSATSTNSPAYAGGIVGVVNDSTIITNCTNSGEVSSSYEAGGIVGYADDSTITNCYSLVAGDGNNGETCTVEQLNSKEFYTETLGWSEDVWDFSELDIENGKYPKLK